MDMRNKIAGSPVLFWLKCKKKKKTRKVLNKIVLQIQTTKRLRKVIRRDERFCYYVREWNPSAVPCFFFSFFFFSEVLTHPSQRNENTAEISCITQYFFCLE